MKRVLKKVIVIVLATIMLLSTCVLGACNRKYYAEKTLEEAYEAGWITQEHLKSIAYYYNHETEEPDFDLIPKAELPRKVEKTVKLSYLQWPGIKKNHPDADENDISAFTYYGTYNDCVVAFVFYKYYGDIFPPVDKEIAGVMFYRYRTLYVYNKNIIMD